MPTLDATVGGADANTYITLANANTYFDERLYVDDWTDASDDDKSRALIMAARRFNQCDWQGAKSASSQALAWPRQDTFDEDGNQYASDEIPQAILDGQCELALELIKSDILADSGLDQFESVAVGPVKIDVRHAPTGDLPPNVRRIVAHILSGSPAGPKLLRG